MHETELNVEVSGFDGKQRQTRCGTKVELDKTIVEVKVRKCNSTYILEMYKWCMMSKRAVK